MSPQNLNELVECCDGFKMSVQAGARSYSTPRIDDAQRYLEVEVGFPSEKEPMLMDWAEDPHQPTETVYAWVPAQVVTNVIAKHGGMVSGEVPPGVAQLRVSGR